MKITVILCTHNRCRDLRVALESVAACVLPASVSWDVLVVDNNSTDQTHDVARDFCARYPARFGYLFEPRPGKSHALNAGILKARGDILAFMDDDVTVDPAWLRNLTAALEDIDWAGAGGRIVLQWPAIVPRWLSTDGPLARHGFPGFDQGSVAKKLDAPPFGTNMAFRKAMFEKHGGFRTDLGPSPYNEIRNEDTEFGRRLISAGERLHYEPSAVVFHPVLQAKLNKKHFLKWGIDKGRGEAREFKVRPIYLFFQIGSWTLRWMTTIDPKARFRARIIVWEKVGTMLEWSRKTFGARKKSREDVSPANSWTK